MSAADHLAQYEALRHGVGGRVVARDVVCVRGPDAVSYLQGQCSQDVASMAVGDTRDALLLSPQGKLEALVRVLRSADDAYLLDVEGGWGATVAARLARFKLRVKAEIDEVPTQCVALRGPMAAEVAPQVRADRRLPFSWNGVVGVDLFGPAVAVPDEACPAGHGAWEAVRVEAGIPAMGAELDERTIAAEADLLERCVSFTKGCYTGQELVARLDARGNKVARRLAGVVVGARAEAGSEAAPAGGDGSAPLPPRAVMVEPEGGAEVGRVTSSALSPVLGVVALGYVHRRVVLPVAVTVRLADGQELAAEARSLPLVGGGSP